MAAQIGFSFDAVLEQMPASQIAPKPRVPVDAEKADFEARVATVLADMPDDITTEDVLDRLDVLPHSRVGWHRARVLAVVMAPHGDWQTYAASPIAKKPGDPPTQWRHRRLAPLEPCPGFEESGCKELTRGGKLCEKCGLIEEEDLFNQA